MLTINGKQFAKNNSEFTDTLFTGGSTAIGFYRVLKNGIKLLDHQKKPLMFIVDNVHNEQFIVSCSVFNGKTRYMYALSSNHEQLIGFDKLGYLEQHEAVKQAIKSIN